MNRTVGRFGTIIGFLICTLFATNAWGADVASTVITLRLANMITGGALATSDPAFAQMLAKVQAGDLVGAAKIAANTSYFAGYLARRLALQMQTPALDASIGTDNDSTTFLIAHFVGGKIKPSLSDIASENATYLVNVKAADGSVSAKHAASLTAAQLAAVNWMTDLVRVEGQTARINSDDDDDKDKLITIPAKHVGGFVTLSDRKNDNSFAQYGASAGTNLRMIEGLWEIATGLELTDVMSTSALPQVAPRFVPETDPNFFHGNGQPACLACHGGGMSSLNHGYSTVADLFDFDSNKGFVYIAAPTTKTMKSLGSDPNNRATTKACDLTKNKNAVCNPDSLGADPNQAWNVGDTWQSTGVLNVMGWAGTTAGQGLNELGKAIGQSYIFYENFTRRVINEICPMGNFSGTQVAQIAGAANPMTLGSNDIRTIVALVAADSSCL